MPRPTRTSVTPTQHLFIESPVTCHMGHIGERQVPVADFAHNLGQVNGMLGLVVCLPRETAGQVGIVAVLVQFTFGSRK